MTTLTKINSINRSPLWRDLLLIVLALALWATPGTVRGQVLHGGDLFVSVNLAGTCNVDGGSSIFQYTPPGPPPSIFAPNLGAPRGLAFDGAGNLFVATNPADGACNAQGTIFKITPDGMMSTFVTGFPLGLFLQGLATDSTGNLFISTVPPFDPNNPNHLLPGTIYKVTPAGTISSFASHPAAGWGMACDSDGNLYAATGGAAGSMDDSEILKFSPDYNPSLGTGMMTTFAGPFPHPEPGPNGLVFDSFGNLFVCTSDSDGNGEILKFAAPVPPQTEWTKSTFATGLTGSRRGLAFDTAGYLFVAAPGVATPGDILEFTPAGTQIVFDQGDFGDSPNRGPEWLAFSTAAVTPPTTAVTLVFPDATDPLTTTVTSIDQNSVPPPPSNFELTGSNLAFNITTPSAPTTPIIIAFTVPSSLAGETLKAMHYESGNWVDSTIYPGDPNYPTNPAPNTIYASVNSLSPFLITKFKFKAQGQQPINADGTSVFTAKRGVVPVAFKLTSDGVATCQLPPATISVFRTAGTAPGPIDESTYLSSADKGSNFRISNCQYVYNLAASSLGTGTYQVYISIGGSVAGSATFALK